MTALLHSMSVTGSVYLSNGYRLAFNCDSVVPAHVAKKKAEAYALRTGKTIYVEGLGTFPQSAPEPDPQPEAVKKQAPRR